MSRGPSRGRERATSTSAAQPAGRMTARLASAPTPSPHTAAEHVDPQPEHQPLTVPTTVELQCTDDERDQHADHDGGNRGQRRPPASLRPARDVPNRRRAGRASVASSGSVSSTSLVCQPKTAKSNVAENAYAGAGLAAPPPWATRTSASAPTRAPRRVGSRRTPRATASPGQRDRHGRHARRSAADRRDLVSGGGLTCRGGAPVLRLLQSSDHAVRARVSTGRRGRGGR